MEIVKGKVTSANMQNKPAAMKQQENMVTPKAKHLQMKQERLRLTLLCKNCHRMEYEFCVTSCSHCIL